jgi:putative thioredoxin
VEAAAASFAAGDLAGAAGLYGLALQEDPTRLDALAGLVRCEVALGNLEQARALTMGLSEAQRRDPAITGALAALDLAEQAESLGKPADLRRRLDAAPDDHQARFDLALALNAAGDRAGAVDALIEIVRRDREWNESGARKQLLQFFEAWGAKDPASMKGRQRLSSLLFS